MEATGVHAEFKQSQATSKTLSAERNLSVSEEDGAPSLPAQVDALSSEKVDSVQQSSTYLRDEQDKPRALADVIDKLSYEKYPEYVRKNDSTLTFPEKLMLMLIHVEQVYANQAKKTEDQSIAWSNNGKSFVIRDKDVLCKSWIPAFFGQAKFSSFTRKLYRWGFRKVNVSINDKGEQIVVFSNENFQRGDVSRLSKMQSITAAKIRNQLAVKTGPRKESPPESTSIGLLENVSDQPSAIDQLLRERVTLPTTAAASFANSSLLQYRQEREQELLRTRSLLATQLSNTRYPTSNSLGLEDASLQARQQAVLNRYRQSPTALTTRGGVGQSSPGRVSLSARSQLENLRLLEALDRQRAGGINSLFSDGSFEQLLLQRQLRAVRSPTVELASSMQALDAYALLRREDESNRLNQNLRSVYLQRLENRSGGNVDPHYLAALEALLQQQTNNR
ncbi:hypothetical protein FisN_21Hh009 [Fistulifera solaris]|uniref:HSF-type DNA-binding domain-containing protein n=1 Tax=Fistulifera solaris TaxID=1519565 RepID=A0A1Z5KAX2_FISSO|nr:hypothetical protein FisN_21Hh009 [Fistulifera solaris]|eukprot:GAX23305.1 hypothetical protein FisN_21Hh009 [Fistulifera solaris]